MAPLSELLAKVSALLDSTPGLAVTQNPAGELLVDCGDGGLPVVVVEHRRGTEHAAVLLGFICPEARMSARDALQLVMQVGAGAIGLVGGAYWVRFTVPAAALAGERLPEAIRYVRVLARDLGAAVDAGPIAVATGFDPFAHYAEN